MRGVAKKVDKDKKEDRVLQSVRFQERGQTSFTHKGFIQ